VLEDYGKKVWKKLSRLADIAGIAVPGDSQNKSTVEEKANAFIKAIYEMNAKMGIPRSFDFIKNEDIPQITQWATKEANPLYPVPVIYGRARFKAIVEKLKSAPAENPEKRKPKINTELCSACAICVHDCPTGALAISLPKTRGDIRVHAGLSKPEKCTACGICEKRCPLGAITQ
jgi:NAD-dependent dihydropyrimidine dehydrogenase PreA subunit